MSRPLLVLRPEPGNAATIARANALGLEAITVPLFEIVPIEWQAPGSAHFDALMVTSANAVRHGGEALKHYAALPVYAVSAATGETLAAAGFSDIRVGPGDAIGLIELLVRDGVSRVLHLCGEDRREPDPQGVEIERVAVYAARAIAEPAGLAEAVARQPVAMAHSPRAAARLSALVSDRSQIALAAISANAAVASGIGWRAVAIADAPTDQALLAIAARMCKQEYDNSRDGPQ
ncbi:uroporphyrinogen-III synthase [Sphingomonas cavernae]|uniref:Uroporphyrinogen-III synthase n=1 Tax=Sphingomonas cavernae TaxID=2320861 RepID=A0A418WRZ9_9SPHN|nr:uroporphyrinogen-III synthase [Sphingomonas cavernae]RJF94005.1 uroporphyrinogen-III synthase [Sphingomonas cavernae]